MATRTGFENVIDFPLISARFRNLLINSTLQKSEITYSGNKRKLAEANLAEFGRQ